MNTDLIGKKIKIETTGGNMTSSNGTVTQVFEIISVDEKTCTGKLVYSSEYHFNPEYTEPFSIDYVRSKLANK